ncbi:MAG: hypothetical protein EOM08_15945 [Clostridia bacterium]|nr:hypothetical protein [Clostridia bacterium]NCC77911.1 hypothetical protein [Clostridia bacterium]
MDENLESNTLAKALAQIQDQNERQLDLMKKQLLLYRLVALLLVAVVMVLVLGLGTTYVRINRTIEHVETVTADLARADWTGMVENINTLVESSQESLGQATAKIDSIDIETLNQSIQDLSTVIGPIARLFGG